MPGRLTTLVKGTFCGGTDSAFGSVMSAPSELIKWLTDQMDASQSLEDVGIKWKVIPDTQEARTHCAHFFGNGKGCFFPNFDEKLKRDVVRATIIKGLRTAIYEKYVSPDQPGNNIPRAQVKPMVMYWIAGGPSFEGYVSDSVAEVHVMLFTPDPTPVLIAPASSREEPIWLIGDPDYVHAIKDRASYKYADPEWMPAYLEVECQQIKSY